MEGASTGNSDEDRSIVTSLEIGREELVGEMADRHRHAVGVERTIFSDLTRHVTTARQEAGEKCRLANFDEKTFGGFP